MIQRIQTVYLAVAIFLNVVFFFSPLFTQARMDTSDWLLPMIAAASAFAIVLSLYGIFLYKNHARQIQIISYACLFQVIAIGSGAGIFMSMGRYSHDSIWELTGLISLIFALMFQLLAIRGIKSDVKLLKSMDRIR
ncbi:MAG: DUF4293 domain-containing protein [Balneolia bacterium]|nr:DUF4293 domain-containing protein [Balneolia bacterium]